MEDNSLVELLNFDHGFSKPGTYRYGPYELVVTQQDIDGLAELTWNASTTLTYDGAGVPVTVHNDFRAGRTAKTASVRLVEALPHGSNVLLAGESDGGYEDLTILLSFLTGRRVYLKEQWRGDESTRYGVSVVDKSYFRAQAGAWPRLDSLAADGLVSALWALIHSKSAPDLIGSIMYVNSAFDAVSSSWAKQNLAKTTPLERAEVKTATAIVKSAIGEAISDRDKAEDYCAKVSNLFQPSAMSKTVALLHSLGVIDKSDPEEVARVKKLNMVRNMAMHKADIPSALHADEEMREQLTACICAVTSDIVAIYLADAAQIDCGLIRRSKDQIRIFFKTGMFRSQNVFDETYDQYLSRISRDWETSGLYPAD